MNKSHFAPLESIETFCSSFIIVRLGTVQLGTRSADRIEPASRHILLTQALHNMNIPVTWQSHRCVGLLCQVTWRSNLLDPPLASSCESMASHRERIIEQTRNICYHCTTDLARDIMTDERKQSALSNDHSNILKLQAVFSHSYYYQRAGKTSLFHMRGVDFTHVNTCCTFKTTYFYCLRSRGGLD